MKNLELRLNSLQAQMHFQALPNQIRQEALAYLKGEQDTIKIENGKYNLGYGMMYDLESCVTLDDEEGELARRAVYLAIQLNPKRMMDSLRYWDNRYEIYHRIGADIAFVLADLKRYVQDLYSEEPGYLMNKLRRIMELSKTKPDSSMMPILLKHYGQVIKDMLEENEKQGIETMQSIILRGLLVMLTYEGNADALALVTKEEALKDLERVLLRAFEQSYTKEKVIVACETYFGENILGDVATFISEENKKAKSTHKIQFLFAIALMCKDYSPLIKNILKLQMAIMGGAYSQSFLESASYYKEDHSYIQFDEVMADLQMPDQFKIEVYSEKCLVSPFEKTAYWYTERLQKIYETNAELFTATYHRLLEADRTGAITLYVLLKKYGASVSEEDVLRLEEIYNKIPVPKYRNQRDYQRYQAAIALFEVSKLGREKTLEALRDIDKSDMLTRCEIGYDIFYKDVEEDALTYFSNILGVADIIMTGVERSPSLDQKVFKAFIKEHIPEANEVVLQKIKEGQDNILVYVRTLYQEEIGMDHEVLVQVMNHRLKTVINFMENFFKDKEEMVRPYFKNLAKVKNKNMQEAIMRLEKKWDSSKVTLAIRSKDNMAEIANYIEEIYEVGNEKYIPFSEEIDWTSVHDKEGKPVSERVLKYYVSEYMLLKEIYLIEACECIKEFINTRELNDLIRNIYKLWLQEGADTKKKNIVLLHALNATAEDITSLKKQIDDWTENARGALAAFSVTAMAMNGSSLALLFTDSIAQKYKNKQVRSSAQAAIEYVAEVRGVSKETLGDKIVPTLGFNQRRELTLDYGSRQFKCILTPELDVVLFDDKGKKIKNLPKPNAQDDTELAEAAKEQLKGLKKQVKTVIKSQKTRLEKAIMTGRTWERQDWEQLFVENPIMNSFAISLIWAECNEAGEVLGTFRYMEDGSFNTIDEEEYEFHEDSRITLLHPIELDADSVSAWKEQLEDYEITQVIDQLDMPVYTLTEGDVKDRSIIRFMNKKVYFGTVLGLMDKYDWKKTSIVDGGGYTGYYYEDFVSGVGIQLNLEFVYVGMEATEEITLQDMQFYKAGTIEYGSYMYDEITEQNSLSPKDIPAKILSFALMIGEMLAAKAI